MGWYSKERFAKVRGQIAFEIAPEICVEILSPSDTGAEMNTKKRLYFEAGAEEVWLCSGKGRMEFYDRGEPDELQRCSRLCPDFPGEI